MLLKFKVENFRSYAEAAELSLLRGTKQRAEIGDARVVRCTPNGPDVLRAAAIFGPNAGGKSNLLKAILWLKQAVLLSAANADELPFETFASPMLTTKAIHFDIEFVVGDIQYHYTTEFLAGTVVLEVLSSKVVGARTSASQLFKRTNQGTDFAVDIQFSSELTDHIDIDQWRRNTRPHQLFLSQSQNLSAAPFLQSAFHWFRSKLKFFSHGGQSSGFRYTCERLVDETFRQRLVNELIGADLGVTGINVKEVISKRSASEVLGQISHRAELSRARDFRVEFEHSPDTGPAFQLDFNSESDGTHLDDVIQNDRILLIDELDRSLHPLLVRRIVRAFSQGKSKGQLVFTTHDATLLDADVLRRDQVWFAERDAQHRSSLRRLAAGNVRLDKALMRAYLDGQFQGVPITDSQGAFGDE
jgi:uncharacterized protein